jgi:hypothetical protein
MNWCFAHPWMTFFIILTVLELIQNIIKYLTHYHETPEEIQADKENKITRQKNNFIGKN